MLHNFVYLYCGITLGCALGALLGLKTPLLGPFSVQNTIMYVILVGFYGAEFKFIGPNT